MIQLVPVYLVGGFNHSEKYARQLGSLFPTEWKNNSTMFQTTNQFMMGLPWFTDGFCWNFPPLGHPDQAVPQLAAHGGTEAFRHQGQAGQEQRGLWKQVKPSRKRDFNRKYDNSQQLEVKT